MTVQEPVNNKSCKRAKVLATSRRGLACSATSNLVILLSHRSAFASVAGALSLFSIVSRRYMERSSNQRDIPGRGWMRRVRIQQRPSDRGDAADNSIIKAPREGGSTYRCEYTRRRRV